MSRHDEEIATDYADWSGLDEDDGDDRYDEFKDDLAMGRIWPDGSYREPDGEPPQEYLEAEAERHYEIHCRQEHGGRECDCPVDTTVYCDEPPF